MLPTTELKVVKNCVILPHDYVYCEDGKISSNIIKSQLLFDDNKPMLFSTYVRQTLVNKITQQLNYIVTKCKSVNKIKVEMCPKDNMDSILYFSLDFSELEDKIDDKILVDIRGLQIVTINNENGVNCKYLMGTIHMTSDRLSYRYDLQSTDHMNVALTADYCLHDSIDDEDLAKFIASDIYSTLEKRKERNGR